jgi:hypothetical protein
MRKFLIWICNKIRAFTFHITMDIFAIVALIFTWQELRHLSEERQFENFTRILELYDAHVEKRDLCFLDIRNAIKASPELRQEIQDNTSTIDYLNTRLNVEKTNLVAIEFDLLRYELESLGYLNELCFEAVSNESVKRIILLKEKYEIIFYIRNEDIINSLYIRQGSKSLPKPNFDFLHQIRDKNPTNFNGAI